MRALRTLAISLTALALIPAGLIAYSSLKYAARPDYDVHSNLARSQATDWLLAQIKPVGRLVKPAVLHQSWPENDFSCTESLDSFGKKTGQAAVAGGRSLASWVAAANTRLLAQSPPAAGVVQGGRIAGNYLLRQAYALDSLAVLQGIKSKTYRASDVCAILQGWLELKPGAASPFADLIWQENLLGQRQQEMISAGLYARTDRRARRANPWAALEGCTYLLSQQGLAYFEATETKRRLLREELCSGGPGQPNHAAIMLPAETQPAGWAQLGINLRMAGMADAPKPLPLIGQRNQVEVRSRLVDQASHVISTLNPAAQEASDSVAQCLASVGKGQAKACAALGISQQGFEKFYEGAAARMMGIAVLDIATGRIEAISGAHTPCYAQQHDGPGRDKNCPDLPAEPRMNGAALDNHALYADAMPGSLVKPIAALAMMQDEAYRRRLMGKEAASLQSELAHSSSRLFHDRLFCADKGFDNCERLGYLPQAAIKMGWNINCLNSAPAAATSTLAAQSQPPLSLSDCARISAATGRDLPSQKALDAAPLESVALGKKSQPYLAVVSGQIGIEQQRDRSGKLLGYAPRPSSFGPDWARECQANGWRKCKGGNDSAIDMLSEAWGQGDARATPLAIAMMFAHLGAAANGAPQVAMPHLLQGFVNPARSDYASPSRVHGIDPAQARLIVGGLQKSHVFKLATATPACKVVLGQTACLDIDWIAGKTGTPAFSHDALTIAQRRATCDAVQAEMAQWRLSQDNLNAQAQPTVAAPGLLRENMPNWLVAEWARCVAVPHKWYAGLVKSPGSTQWDKVVVVLAERNWTLADGKVDAPGDYGINIAARAAFEVIKRLYAQRGVKTP